MFSCKKAELETLLTDPQKRWVYMEAEKVAHKKVAVWYMKFNMDNSSENRYLSDGSELIQIDGKEEKCNWYYDEVKETVDICNYKFHVTRYVADTVYLTNLQSHEESWLVNKNFDK
jgi:hypothetical protein